MKVDWVLSLLSQMMIHHPTSMVSSRVLHYRFRVPFRESWRDSTYCILTLTGATPVMLLRGISKNDPSWSAQLNGSVTGSVIVMVGVTGFEPARLSHCVPNADRYQTSATPRWMDGLATQISGADGFFHRVYRVRPASAHLLVSSLWCAFKHLPYVHAIVLCAYISGLGGTTS